MSVQENVERNVRMTLGDLSLQVIMLRAELDDLKEQLAAKEQVVETPAKANGGRQPSKEAAPAA